MVNCLLFLFFNSLEITRAEAPFTFRLEVSQSKVFQGEQVTANFVLESPTERGVEIEVMKFPEFRGFWSENQILRQGPVHLMSGFGTHNKAMALIGSYSLSSIVGIQSPKVEPMRILVKAFGQPPVILHSEGNFPTILDLPPIPAQLKRYPFSGAVGNFSLSAPETQVPFRKNQPFLLRASLQGEGNFAEINTLPLVFSEEFHLISQSSSIESVSGRSRKSFEWVLSTDRDSLTELSPGGFLIFDPSSKSYQLIQFPNFQFIALPETALPGNILKMNAIEFSPEPSWRTDKNFQKSFWIWFIQTLIALCLVVRILYVQIGSFRIRRNGDPNRHRQLTLKKAAAALKKHNWEEFLSLASRISRQLITEKNLLISSDSLKLFIEADNQLRFSPSKTLMIPKETLIAHWKSLCVSLQKAPQRHPK